MDWKSAGTTPWEGKQRKVAPIISDGKTASGSAFITCRCIAGRLQVRINVSLRTANRSSFCNCVTTYFQIVFGSFRTASEKNFSMTGPFRMALEQDFFLLGLGLITKESTT